MFFDKYNHKNTAKFFLFFGKSVQKWSKKKDDTEKIGITSSNHNFLVK